MMSGSWFGHSHGKADSPVHRLPAAVKLGVGLVLVVGSVVAPMDCHAWFIGAVSLLGAAALVSRVSPWFMLKRLLLLSPFVLGVAVANAIHPGPRGNWLAVAIRSAICLFTVILVSNVTPFSKTLDVLRRARLPGLLLTTMALMHRYLFVLADESERMRRARLSRSFSRRRRFHWSSLATVVSQLFIRASERAERIYDAMCARGWK